MNAEMPTLDLAECANFISSWCRATGMPHLTLTAIVPDGATATATFEAADTDRVGKWIARAQQDGRNVYFEVNETPARSVKKPTKALMIAAVCRHADVDPLDGEHPYHEERDRLHRLAEFLRDDPIMPPTAILDSGNGIQPLWAIARESLTAETIERIEAENRTIEAAVGAAGTHNIDRLLRLPGTLNYPNAKKQKTGRGVSRARLLHFSPISYGTDQAATLGKHLAERLAGTDLVRAPAKASEPSGSAKGKQTDRDRSRAAFRIGGEVRRNGGTFDQMVQRLRADAETADWFTEKGQKDGQRELKRIWEKSDAGAADKEIAAVLQDFNARYMVVNEAGKAMIYQPAFDASLGRRFYNRLSPRDLGTLYMNRLVEVGVDENGKSICRTASDIWLRHPDRREFIHGVTFDPTTTESLNGVLNLWTGFAIKPAPGVWALMRMHIFSIICDGDEGTFEYTMNWMARMVQRPAEQGEVAIVMKGGEGTGKGTLAKVLLKIMGHHGLAISNAKHLVGNFNGHLRDAILLFADEAFFAGDKQHVGTLKSLITEPYLTVEAKFANAVQSPNFLHVMMASNESWVVPASLDARRFLVLVVSEAAKGNHGYFAEIWAEMEAGGYGAMLHDLLHRDISAFNVRDVPQTEGLREQRTLSLPTTEAWWKDCLERGYVFQSKLGLEADFAHWSPFAATDLLFASYTTFAERSRERRPMSREELGKFIRRMGGTASRPRGKPIGEHLVDVPTAFGSQRIAQPHIHENPPGYLLGPLADARAAFCQETRLAVVWPGDDVADEEAA